MVPLGKVGNWKSIESSNVFLLQKSIQSKSLSNEKVTYFIQTFIHLKYPFVAVCPETDSKELLEQFNSVSMIIELTLGYPCYVAKTWMHYKFMSEKAALSLMGYGAVTTLFCLNGSPIALVLVDGSVNLSTYSLILLSVEKDDLVVEIALGCVAMGYYLLRSQVYLLGYLSPEAVYYFCQTAFVFLSLAIF